MKKKVKSLMVVIMTLAMVLSIIPNAVSQTTSAAIETIKLTEEKVYELKPGEVSKVKFSVKSTTGTYIYDPKITISSKENAPFSFSSAKMYIGEADVRSISPVDPTDIVFDVTVKDTAKIGTYTVTVKFDYIDILTNAQDSATIDLKFKVTEEKIPAQLTVSNVYLSSSSIGSNAELVFTVKNEGETLARNAYLKLDFGEGIEEKYTVKNIKLGDLAKGDVKDLKLPIYILPTAASGRRTVKASFTYKNSDGSEEFTSNYEFSINLNDAVDAAKLPKLVITDLSYDSDLKPGDEFILNVKLENVGEAVAENVEISVDSSSMSATGIIKNFYMDSIPVDDIYKNGKASVKLPLKVSKASSGGLLPVKLVVTYLDNEDANYSFNETVYIDVMLVEEDDKTNKPNIVVSNVKQSPAKPEAGGRVEISFDLENKGNADAEGLMVSLEGYSDETFIPVDSDPYQYFEVLKAGEKMRVTIPLFISKEIPEGLNKITVKVAYDSNINGVTYPIPVKDIQNDAVGTSKPVLLITNYKTDKDELVAGSIFNLTFDVFNTNAATAARNIKLEIVLDGNSPFSLTQGNNTFYISKLNPEESTTYTLPLKIKSTATTAGYPITFKLDYEYDGYVPDKDSTDKGSSVTINLPVKEHLRPMVDNVYLYSWDGPVYMGSPATLHLDFFNMGYSPLNNVMIMVEGDFTKADGSMYFMGNVPNGSSNYADFDVIPNVMGSAKGILRISYEDSNGDKQEFLHEFTYDVMDPASMPMPDFGGFPSEDVFNPGGAIAKKNILPLWAFILIQCGIFILFVPISRKAIISIYKARLLKKEQEKY